MRQFISLVFSQENIPVLALGVINIRDVDHLQRSVFIGSDQNFPINDIHTVLVFHTGGDGDHLASAAGFPEKEVVGIEQATVINSVFGIFSEAGPVPGFLDFVVAENLHVFRWIGTQFVVPGCMPILVIAFGHFTFQGFAGVEETFIVGQPAANGLFPATQTVLQHFAGFGNHHLNHRVFIAAVGHAVSHILAITTGIDSTKGFGVIPQIGIQNHFPLGLGIFLGHIDPFFIFFFLGPIKEAFTFQNRHGNGFIVIPP